MGGHCSPDPWRPPKHVTGAVGQPAPSSGCLWLRAFRVRPGVGHRPQNIGVAFADPASTRVCASVGGRRPRLYQRQLGAAPLCAGRLSVEILGFEELLDAAIGEPAPLDGALEPDHAASGQM